jgi:hypothetical protein
MTNGRPFCSGARDRRASGAEITRVDLAEDLDDAAIAAIRRAWLDSLAQHHPISGYDAWRGAMHRVTLAGGQPR